jgi:hypothetical protein
MFVTISKQILCYQFQILSEIYYSVHCLCCVITVLVILPHHFVLLDIEKVSLYLLFVKIFNPEMVMLSLIFSIRLTFHIDNSEYVLIAFYTL